MMKTQLALIMALSAMAGSLNAQTTDFSKWKLNNYVGVDSLDAAGAFHTYQVPTDYPYMEGKPRFNVSVNKTYTGVYNDSNTFGGNVSFGYFDFADGTPVEVEIACRASFTDFEVLPASAELLEVSRTETSVKIKLSKADQNLTLILNDNYKGDVLHLFCNSIDTEAPAISADGYKYDTKTRTYYFGPGYYNLSDMFANGRLTASGTRHIYLAGGAVLDGSLALSSATTASIKGRGMVVNTGGIVVETSGNRGGVIEGILIHGHRPSGWTTTLYDCQSQTLRNVKIVSTRYASTDGLDVTYCQDCTFDNLFIRACDDAVAIKAMASETQKPEDSPANRDLTFTRMQLWNDCNNGFGLGAETRASAYENITLRDSEILFSYDDPNHHEELDERSALNICSLNGTYFRNITFENIIVHRCERLIGAGYKDSFWFGSIQGDQTTPGEMTDIVYRNITCAANSGSSIANEIHLYGWHEEGTPDKPIHGITFDNVVIEGNLLTSADDPHIVTNNTDELSLVYDLRFGSTPLSSVRDEATSLSLSPNVVNRGEAVRIATDEAVRWSVIDLTGHELLCGVGSVVDTTSLPSAMLFVRIRDNAQAGNVAKLIVR